MRFLVTPVIGLLCYLPALLPAQTLPPPMKYGFISKEDLEMKVYPPDTSAAAVVLCDYGTVHFDYVTDNPIVVFTRHRRIKFLRRAGFEYGNIVIPYPGWRKFRNLTAQVLDPDGITNELTKKDFFDEEVQGQRYGNRQIRFAFPNLKEGSVAEFKYEIESRYLFELPQWFFQDMIPVRWSEYRLSIPVIYQYVTLLNGLPLTVTESKLGRANLSGESSEIRLALKEAPALKVEPYITTMGDYLTRVRFQLERTQHPYQAVQPIMTTWEQAAKDLLADENFGWNFTKKSRYDKVWAAAQKHLSGASTPEQKIKALYRFAQTSFDQKNYYQWYAAQDFNEAFEKKSASPSALNLLLVALLRETGLQAHPMLVSMRGDGQPVPKYPFLDQFSHVLTYVENGDKPMLLDVGSSFRPAGMVSEYALNGQGWLVHTDKPRWVPISPVAASETYFGSFRLDEEGNLKGKIQISEEGYSALDRREAYHKKKPDEYWKEEIQKRYPDAQPDSLIVENKDELDQALRAKFNFSCPGYAQVSGDFIYVNPVFFSDYFQNPFKSEHRTYPVDMPYPMKERVVCELVIPSGYKVESLPEPARLTLPNNGGRFQYSVENKEDKIILNANISIAQLRYEPTEYDALRSFFGMIAEKYGEQIVLKKG
jgi:hypothetical protein